MLFGKREVFMTNQMEQYATAKQALTQAGIHYDLKTFSASAQGGRNRGRAAGAGGRLDLELFYYLYVKRNDEEKARYAIREAFRKKD